MAGVLDKGTASQLQNSLQATPGVTEADAERTLPPDAWIVKAFTTSKK